jgi:hypothetical protein
MRKVRIKFISTAFLLLCGWIVFSSYHNGAAKLGLIDCTGAEKTNLKGCSNGGPGCHTTNVQSLINLSITVDSLGVLTNRYLPGMTYQVTLKGINKTNDSLPFFGFQLACIAGDTSSNNAISVGSWDTTQLPNLTQLTHSSPGLYNIDIIEQTDRVIATTGNGKKGTTYTKSFYWTAPNSGLGKVTFFAVLNAINNDYHMGGDYWNTCQTTLVEASPDTTLNAINLDISGLKSDIFIPTLFNEYILINKLNSIQSNSYDLKVIDLNGNVLISKKVNFSSVSMQEKINSEKLGNGIYFLTLLNELELITKKILKFN